MTPGDSKRLALCWWGCGARAPGGPRAPCPQGAPQVGLTSRQEGSQPLRPSSGGPSHRLPAQEASPEPPRDQCPLPSFASRVLSVTPRPPHQGRRVWTRALPFLTPPQPPSHPGWLAAQELPGSRSGARAGWGSGLRLQAGVLDETRGWVGSCLGVQGSRPGGRPEGNATHQASGPSVTRWGRGGQEGGPPGSRLSQRLNPGLRGSLLLLPKPGDSRSPAACPTPDQQPGGLGVTGVTLGAMLLPAAPPGDTLPGPGVAFLTERQPHTKAQWAGGRWPGRAR